MAKRHRLSDRAGRRHRSANPGPQRTQATGLTVPSAIASDGTHVWVANEFGASVTELDAATGAPIKIVAGPKYEFDGPDAVASDGTHVWVTNWDGQSVTEFPASSN